MHDVGYGRLAHVPDDSQIFLGITIPAVGFETKPRNNQNTAKKKQTQQTQQDKQYIRNNNTQMTYILDNLPFIRTCSRSQN